MSKAPFQPSCRVPRQQGVGMAEAFQQACGETDMSELVDVIVERLREVHQLLHSPIVDHADRAACQETISIAQSEIERLREAVKAERTRCADLLNCAREGLLDTDLRSIRSAIESGTTRRDCEMEDGK